MPTTAAATAANRAFGNDRGLPFPLADLGEADAVLLVGSNLADTMPPVMQYVDAGRSAGATHVVVDPRASATTRQAALHLQPVPGTDLTLGLGMLNVAVREGLVDEEYAEHGITLHAGVRVERIDRLARRVLDSRGESTPYDVAVIATGSRPFMPDIKNLRNTRRGHHQAVFGFRTIEDTRRMIGYARDHERAVVIGGALLGLEAARGLQGHGMQVTVVHGGGHLMNHQLDADAGRILGQQIRALGIEVVCGARTTEVTGTEEITGVLLADGRHFPCDMIVVTAGVRANSELAALSGLSVERGIVVDDQMRTVEDPRVYAVGECAQHRGQVYGLVAPLWEQARVLADQVTGADPTAAYHRSRTATKLKVAGVDVTTMGLRAPEREDDEYVVFSEPRRGVHKSVILREDRLVGATLVGDVSRTAFLMQAFDRGLALPQERASLLFDLGTPPAAVWAADLADDAQVCNCNGVSRGAIVRSVRDGVTCVSGVMNATRAGSGCGSCKSLVSQIVDWAADPLEDRAPVASGLLG